MNTLADVPRPSGCKKLRGTDLWRLRVERYRVVYAIDDKARLVTVVKVASRREDTYQGL
ncbi:MAG: type II toxin-antitoxin system RelE/ParE family toxin [Chloroflexi bacterium]|nr:type II toxin-antitoxin system RelE/ParE family toxin [Chloroflexota bacterium]